LSVKDVLNRRLQSIVYRKGFARSAKQARQFIVHRHVIINDKEMTVPGYLVSLAEEHGVSFKTKSSLADEEHPERVSPEDVVAEEVAKVTGKKEEVVAVKEELVKEVKETKEAPVEEKPEEKNEKGNEKTGTEK